MADDGEICGCNGVSKAKVVAAIEGGAETLDAVRACTKASGPIGANQAAPNCPKRTPA